MAWYDQLFTNLKDLAAAVATDVKAILPRLIPAGGTDGQVLTKSTATAYVTKWSTPAAGSGASPLIYPDSINNFLQATDRLLDMSTNGGPATKQGHFQQIVAERSHQVGGISFNIFRTGSVAGSNYANAVAIFDTVGTMLAVAEAGSNYMGSTGWKQVYFSAPINLVAGQKYILAIMATGDGVPGWGAAPGNANYNINTGSLPRCFRKANLTTLNANLDFTTGLTAQTGERIFMAMIPPA